MGVCSLLCPQLLAVQTLAGARGRQQSPHRAHSLKVILCSNHKRVGAQAGQQNKAGKTEKTGTFYRAEQQRGMPNYLSMLVLKTIIG